MPRSRTGSRPGGKRAQEQVGNRYLEEALKHFSGYLAADELYDGPFAVLSLVDNRSFRRLSYLVLEHDPTEADVRSFFARFKAALNRQGLPVRGITTDGSPLYPGPIAEVFGAVPHQICRFHILRELTRAVLHAVNAERQRLAAQVPELPPRRPRPGERARARRAEHLRQQVAELFAHRHWFVARHLRPRQRQILRRLTRTAPALRRLRPIMDRVYGLFDRRCRSLTALLKLAELRRQVKQFPELCRTLKKLFSLNLDHALTFLDDKHLPATANAVERGNRRHRKMQKSIYCVRTQQSLVGRIALDMQREAQARGRAQATAVLHLGRPRKPAL